MKKAYLAAACAATLLAAAGFANAQGTKAGSSSSGVSQNQCWDVSNNVVRDRSGTNATGPSGETKGTVGSTSPTSPGSSSAASGPTGTSSNANASTRPPGMPDC